MPTLAEIIAARKAASNPIPTPKAPAVVEAKQVEAKETGDGFVDAMNSLTKEEPPIAVAEKPMSFAEKLAAKRALSAQAEQKPPEVPTPAKVYELPVEPAEAVAPVEKEKKAFVVAGNKVAPTFMQKLIPAAAIQADTEDLEREEYKQAPPEVQDGYRDIKSRVHALADYDDSALEEPMSQLKKALLANPNACLLMLDEDIGKMTIALRRLVQESLVEVTKEKKEAKSKKTLNIPLSAEQMQKVFDEL